MRKLNCVAMVVIAMALTIAAMRLRADKGDANFTAPNGKTARSNTKIDRDGPISIPAYTATTPTTGFATVYLDPISSDLSVIHSDGSTISLEVLTPGPQGPTGPAGGVGGQGEAGPPGTPEDAQSFLVDSSQNISQPGTYISTAASNILLTLPPANTVVGSRFTIFKHGSGHVQLTAGGGEFNYQKVSTGEATVIFGGYTIGGSPQLNEPGAGLMCVAVIDGIMSYYQCGTIGFGVVDGIG